MSTTIGSMVALGGGGTMAGGSTTIITVVGIFFFMILFIGTVIGFLCLLPFVLAFVTLLRPSNVEIANNNNNNNNDHDKYNSALFAGRVWHTRLLPVRHAFHYPLFYFGLDLYEIEQQNGSFQDWLWPLSIIMSFCPSRDHLKNGEGLMSDTDAEGEDLLQDFNEPLSQRICRLVSTQTRQQFCPSNGTHRILLVTHLRYYGYCFNPVSFYLLFHRNSGQLDAVVGEVSNTPWNEMYCYVLHSSSVDQVQVHTTTTPRQNGELSKTTINYVFPKKFHVSPFFEMNYNYDWTFTVTYASGNNDDNNDCEQRHQVQRLHIVNELRSIDRSSLLSSSSSLSNDPMYKNRTTATDDSQQEKRTTLHFRATMVVARKSLHPWTLATYIASFPFYCFMIQLWIHYQAFWLFVKGVPYQPHPDGTVTTTSQIIGALMTPFYAIKDTFMKPKKATKSE